MQKRFTVFLAVIAATSIIAVSAQAPKYISWADRNSDGVITLEDKATADAYYAANIGAVKRTPRPTATAVVAPTATTPVSTASPTVTAIAPTATSPVPTPVVTPTEVPHHHEVDECGNPIDAWHVKCLHEHGDAPPQWLVDAVNNSSLLPKPLFNHMHGTGPAENTAKHAFMKGYRLVDPRGPRVEAYAILHGSGVIQERVGRFHSAQVWVKDSSGGVSYASWWNDYGKPCLWKVGDPENGCGRMRSFVDFDNRPSNQGAIRIIDGQGLEQWYPTPHGLGPDVPMLFSVVERFDPNEVCSGANCVPVAGPGYTNPSLYNNLEFSTRFVEVIWHQNRFNAIPTGTSVPMSQFGEIVSDSACGNPDATVSYDGQSYKLLCARWFITPQLRNDLNNIPLLFGSRSFRLENRDSSVYDVRDVRNPN